MANTDPSERIVLEHDGIEGTITMTRRQFDLVYKAKGWKVKTTEAEREQELLEFDVETARKPALITKAEALGIDSRGTAEDIRERIKAS